MRAGKIHESRENRRTRDTRGAPKINVVLKENPLKLRNFVFPISCSDLHACNEFASLRLWNASCNVSVSKRTTDYFSKRKLTFSKLGFPHTQPPSQGFSAGEEVLVSSLAQKPRERGCDLPGTMGRSKGELKAEISSFSNIFFAKSNISEVNLVKLFSLVYCFFARKLRSKLDFSRFYDLFINCGLKN